MLIPLKFHRNQRLSVKSITGIEVATRNDENLTMQEKLSRDEIKSDLLKAQT